MLAFLIVQLVLAAPSIPPTDQTTSPASQQQAPVGEATEQKGETPTTTTQTNTPSAEPKPSNGARTGATLATQPSRTAVDTNAGGSTTTAMPMAEHRAHRHHIRHKRRPPTGVH